MVLDGHERNGQMVVKLPWDEVPESLGYHDYCYRRFTDIKRIRGAEKRCEQKAHLYDNENNNEEGQQLGEECVPDENIDYEPSPKKLRSASTHKSTRNVLPAVCIICNRTDLYRTAAGKRIKDRLCQAETQSAGM